MADAITKKNITSVDEVQSVDNTDKVFVNDNGSFKQISVSNLMKQAPSGVTEETDPTVSEWAKQPTKPSYTADEVGALPVGTKIPTKTSDLTNDSGYLTQIPEEYVTETELGQKGYVIEDDIPEKLPSPGILTFTGAVNDTYDGSADKTINIPTGGGGGTSDYNALTSKPQINGVELSGNKTSDDLGISGMTEEQEEQLNQNTQDIQGKVSKDQGTLNAGKVLGIGADGMVTPMDPQGNIEQMIENYYALRRTGKVYQTKIWKFASNPTSTGEKLLDNAGLVFEPSTDTEEGRDDYLNGQHPLFEWVHCNYVRDADDGTARPTALEGTSGYATTGAVDVGAMQMSFYWKWDASNPEYDLITISDSPHPELGLVPWCECKKADGTTVPWCIGSAYISGKASDGKLRSQPGLPPERNQSHNNIITNYSEKGEGYKGAGTERNTFQFIFNAIKGATKSSQSLFAGVVNWNIQYEASIQSVDNRTYFPVTNAQAENIPLGTCVSVGYGGNNSGTANNDRGQASIHEYANDVKVLRKEALPDGKNTAIYLDIPETSAFNTMPHVYDDTFSAPIILSSMHAVAGLTDSVIGHHDGSPVSNTDSKHPYRVQGREYLVGGYIVASDTVAYLNADGSRTVYTAEKGTVHSNNQETILSTYKNAGTIPNSATGTAADWYIGDLSLDENTAAWWPSAEGSGSTQGVCDRYYAGGASSDTLREYLQGGHLWLGSLAGVGCLDLNGALSNGHWFCLACD